MADIRLYTHDDLATGQEMLLDGNAGHYLVNVMRQKVGGKLALFNGRDGEWQAEIIKVGKGKATVCVAGKTQDQPSEPDLWYLFAPIKKARLEYMAEKATELGVSLIRPVITDYTNQGNVKIERLQANAIEASEQCERLTVPEVLDPVKLPALLESWPDDRLIMFCDEAGEDVFTVQAAEREVRAWQDGPKKWAILIGPEGGFSPEERNLIRRHPNTVAVTLGPRILRADTAAIAAISLWQSFMGDWGE